MAMARTRFELNPEVEGDNNGGWKYCVVSGFKKKGSRDQVLSLVSPHVETEII